MAAPHLALKNLSSSIFSKLPFLRGHSSSLLMRSTTTQAARSTPIASGPLLVPTTIRPFSSSSPSTMSTTHSFWDVVKERRTYYALNKETPVADDRIIALVKDTILHTPSAFNSQSARLVVLLKADHDKFWDMVKEVLKPIVPAEVFPTTEKKINGFKAGYGTILFFEDFDTVHAFQQQFPIYTDLFPQWSDHTSAMHQFTIWAGLEAEGLGCNLQHYNPIIDKEVKDFWKIPHQWSLKAQLVFGGRAGLPSEKTFKPVEGERLFVHGK